MENVSVFSGVSHPMQLMIADVLSDDAWVDSYLAESNEVRSGEERSDNALRIFTVHGANIMNNDQVDINACASSAS